MNADEARCVGEITGVRVRKYKGIEHFDPRLFLEAPLRLTTKLTMYSMRQVATLPVCIDQKARKRERKSDFPD